MTRPEAKAETRRRLRDCAAELFRAQDVRTTSIADITSSAGVALGTFYVHYKSKDELVDELVRARNESLVRALVRTALASQQTTLRGLLGDLSQSYLRFWREFEGDFAIFIDYLARHSTRETLVNGSNPALLATLERTQRKLKGVRPIIAPSLVAGVVSTLWRTFAFHLLSREAAETPLESQANALTDGTVALLQVYIPGFVELEPSELMSALAESATEAGITLEL
ncbi:MAG: TetR/AcrR family transcriptional regulator [Deltaproteobacteria bacterium]|nr:TetR/AcrR family transcriptional regulator [Deltaproteobacteria bacterium]